MRAAALVFLIILMEGTDNFVIEKGDEHNGEQKLLLKKLLSLQQNDSTEKSTVWNEIFANVLVDKIKTIFNKQPERGIEDKPDAVTDFFSDVIGLFKSSYWDKMHKRHADAETQTNDDRPSDDPKHDVEEIDPKYHGRIENGTGVDTRVVCPEGSVSNGKGDCVDSKNLKFILAIPYQCPFGYRRDRLGYCRPVF